MKQSLLERLLGKGRAPQSMIVSELLYWLMRVLWYGTVHCSWVPYDLFIFAYVSAVPYDVHLINCVVLCMTCSSSQKDRKIGFDGVLHTLDPETLDTIFLNILYKHISQVNGWARAGKFTVPINLFTASLHITAIEWRIDLCNNYVNKFTIMREKTQNSVQLV